MKEKLKAWLQVFRAQSAPLTVIIVMAAYLHGEQSNLIFIIGLIPILLCVHYISYGHNSLMDTAMGYDKKDPAKKHHPLITEQISIQKAHQVIHSTIIILAIVLIATTILIAENIILGLVMIIIFIATGHAYNDGLSKESLLAAPVFSIMTCSIVAWGWYLSHETLDIIGMLYLIYIFLLMMFLDSYDGSLKDIQMPEKSSILKKLGVKIEKRQTDIERIFHKGLATKMTKMIDHIIIPIRAIQYALLLKILAFITILIIITIQYSDPFIQSLALIWAVTVYLTSALFWVPLTTSKKWDHKSALSDMSFEQIFSICLPIPLIAPPIFAIPLIICGIIYFWGVNSFVWESTFHPRV